MLDETAMMNLFCVALIGHCPFNDRMYSSHSSGKSCRFLELQDLQHGATLFFTDFPPLAMGTM